MIKMELKLEHCRSTHKNVSNISKCLPKIDQNRNENSNFKNFPSNPGDLVNRTGRTGDLFCIRESGIYAGDNVMLNAHLSVEYEDKDMFH